MPSLSAVRASERPSGLSTWSSMTIQPPARPTTSSWAFDPDFSYEALKRASFAVQDGAELIAANADASFPAPDGLWPGAGALVAAVEAASGGRRA